MKTRQKEQIKVKKLPDCGCFAKWFSQMVTHCSPSSSRWVSGSRLRQHWLMKSRRIEIMQETKTKNKENPLKSPRRKKKKKKRKKVEGWVKLSRNAEIWRRSRGLCIPLSNRERRGAETLRRFSLSKIDSVFTNRKSVWGKKRESDREREKQGVDEER